MCFANMPEYVLIRPEVKCHVKASTDRELCDISMATMPDLTVLD